ncbi:hypothetical protein FNW25_15845 [Flavobacterium franklandianum]|uniref:hypothetical protein n=1 Tax=Flavobacterium franklandianum TaxID=2594430 RepID=UPI00117A88C8|nr:hypothetical protein [Flavobacterium franklandianum]TRX21473.1 hypothetical protein FNW25_15845 [Flavobacterium franklandianum]
MNKLYFIFLIIILASCQNQKKEGVLNEIVNNIKAPSPKDEIEKLLPHINVSKGNNYNDNEVSECIIELSIGNSREKIDAFFPSTIDQEHLAYCDLSKNSPLPEGVIQDEDVNELKKEIFPQKFGKLLNMSFATIYQQRLMVEINRYCLFINNSNLTITKDNVGYFGAPEKDTIKDFEIVFKKSLSSIVNEIKNPAIKNNSNVNSEKAITVSNQKPFNEIQLTLTDASIKKAKIYLGEPDKYEYGFGHVSKGFAVYYNRVSNNGKPKHLVLFLRMQGNQWGNNAEIEEIYSVEDGQKACFGIHCIMIKNQTIYTNALDLIYDRGYEKL